MHLTTSPRRRAERRDPIAIHASLFSGTFDAPVEVAACDLSPTGAFLRSDLLLSLGETVLLAFTVPGSSHRILVDARVVRTTFDDRAGMGLEFSRLAGAEDKLLRRALERLRSIVTRPPVRDGGFRC